MFSPISELASMPESELGVCTILGAVNPGAFWGAEDEMPAPGAMLVRREAIFGLTSALFMLSSAWLIDGLMPFDLELLVNRGMRVGVAGLGDILIKPASKDFAGILLTEGDPVIVGRLALCAVSAIRLSRFDRGTTGSIRFCNGVCEASSIESVSSRDTVDAGKAVICMGGRLSTSGLVGVSAADKVCKKRKQHLSTALKGLSRS